ITSPRDVAWVDSVTLAVLTHNEEEESAVYLLPVAGPVTELNPIEQGKAVVSGKGEREIWVVTEEGRILNRAGNSWRQIGEDEAVVDLAYPG
ncbi:MAG TPA: LpqB family beta-propeller domain-containing protein, partial [Beutenbergiaceae bacterium]|nr:LpqB family beta-propeller domain-containing protein [Beutenbergiaceae bacterium]